MAAPFSSNVSLVNTPINPDSPESAPIVLIATDVQDPHTLVDTLPGNAVIRFVDNWLDSLSEVLYLAGQMTLKDIHFICHGRGGRPLLAGNEISSNELHQSRELLSQLDAALGQCSTLYLHPWETNGHSDGTSFVSELASLTRMPIVCSTDSR